jgi:hypothetical protein
LAIADCLVSLVVLPLSIIKDFQGTSIILVLFSLQDYTNLGIIQIKSGVVLIEEEEK